ncbi:MAG: hypothetical protein R2684_16445 [Pyrinomonadaceae bacterium]
MNLNRENLFSIWWKATILLLFVRVFVVLLFVDKPFVLSPLGYVSVVLQNVFLGLLLAVIFKICGKWFFDE